MKSKKYVYILVGVVLLIALVFDSPLPAPNNQGPQQVQVVNTALQPVPTAAQGTTAISGNVGISGNSSSTPLRVLDQSANPSEPFQVTLQPFVGIKDGEAVGGFAFPIPSGKRLVIQYISVFGRVPTGQKLYAVGIGVQSGVTYFLPFVPQGTVENTDAFTASQELRLYAQDPVIGVGVQVFRNSTVGNGVLIISISGYLVPIP